MMAAQLLRLAERGLRLLSSLSIRGSEQMTKLKTWAAAAALPLLACCMSAAIGTGGPDSSCEGSPEANRRIVLAFYKQALADLQPRMAFERYMAPRFVEHKPDVPQGTREATAIFLEQLIADLPQPKWEVVRTIAEGDLVFLHARFTPAKGAPDYAIADIFRLEDCRIVEHWDVVAPPPGEQRNPNSRF